jgi:hypothetical protein
VAAFDCLLIILRSDKTAQASEGTHLQGRSEAEDSERSGELRE